MIARVLNRLGPDAQYLTPGLADAAIGQAYDYTRGEWWRREWDAAKKRVLKARFPHWFKKKPKDESTLFDTKDQTQWTK